MTLSGIQAGAATSAAAIDTQARNFETMAISQMLKPMFDTVSTPDAMFGGSDAEKSWQPFLLDAIAKQMEASGGLGLAGRIADAMKEKPVQ